MKKIPQCFFVCLLWIEFAFAQQQAKDSTTLLHEVVITAFEQHTDISGGTIVKVLNNNTADRNNKTSLVNSFNSIAGVRMEERSPASYRINIRGSSLRSPFGVRNVKVYWNDIPVTDPGGNTYFNEFAFNNFSYIEIIKGPAGSMYGAGTGGALLTHSFNNWYKPFVNISYLTGSYNLQNILATIAFGEKNNRNIISFGHNQSDGYRNHTRSQKDNLSFVSQLKNSDKQQITASILYTNLFYETPGALTLAQYIANPVQSRPAAGALPSATTAKAAIFQKNFLAGINQQYHFNNNFKNTTSVYGSFAQIINPTFLNYEIRNEPSFGARTSFVYDKKINKINLQWVAGGELQEGFFNTQDSKNKNGKPDTLLTNDNVRNEAYTIFAQATININESWIITAGASINRLKVGFTRLSVYPILLQSRTYKNQLSPRVALQKKLTNSISIFASISKGFSPPTIAELLPSTGVISTFLQAEEGINYELGGRLILLKNKLNLEATGFYFKLNNALVARADNNGASYFVNAGNTMQNGIELSADYYTNFKSNFFDYLTIKPAATFDNFKYGNFIKGTTSYNGKYLPSVPKTTFSLLADVQLKKGIYLYTTYYAASKIFLDDANTAVAAAYHLLGCRAGYKAKIKTATTLNIYAGVDNLLNETYSLGNDINAAAGRYYNAAPKRNYYVSISFQLNKKDKK